MSKQRDEDEEEEMTLSVWLRTWAIPSESEEVIESIRYEFEQHDIKDVKELSQRNLRLNVMKAMGIQQDLAENIKSGIQEYSQTICSHSSPVTEEAMFKSSSRPQYSFSVSFDDKKCTALPFEIICNDGDKANAVKEVIKREGPNSVMKRDDEGRTPLHLAIERKRSADVIMELVNACPEATKVTNLEGNNSLHLALLQDIISVKIVRILTSACPGAVKERNNKGDTPVHLALKKASRVVEKDSGNLLQLKRRRQNAFNEIISLMVMACPKSVKVVNSEGNTPLHLSVIDRMADTVVMHMVTVCPDAVILRNMEKNTPLHEAMRRNASEKIIFHMVNKCPEAVTKLNERLSTPLHWLTCDTSLRTVSLLVSEFPEMVNTADYYNMTPVQRAICGNASSDVVSAMVSAYPDTVLKTDKENNTILHWALMNEACPEVISLLVKSKPEAVSCTNNDGNTPLHSALVGRISSIEIIRIMVLKCPTAVTRINKDGDTPLHVAIRKSSSHDIVALMVMACPASLSQKNNKANTPLHFAFNEDSPDNNIALMLEYYPEAMKEANLEGDTPLHVALRGNASDEIITLAIGACPEAVKIGWSCNVTPLHEAVSHMASIEVIGLLISHWPEATTVQDHNGSTPLHTALVRGSSSEIFSLLLLHGPDAAKIVDNNKCTPLHVALMNNAPMEVVTMLLCEWPQALQRFDSKKCTPLHRALIHQSSVQVVELLLRQWPDVMKPIHNEGQTLLHRAIKYGTNPALLAFLAVHEVSVYKQMPIHLCGDSRAGKTTLRESLRHCIRNKFGSFTLPPPVTLENLENTIGLEKHNISSKSHSKEVFVVYDYGGEMEYHVNHGRHLASGGGSIYIVVIGMAEVLDNNDIRPRGDQDKRECKHLLNRYKYWLRFINSVAEPGSQVMTVLNFKSVASANFCRMVEERLLTYQANAGYLINLKFSGIYSADVMNPQEVYSAGLFNDHLKDGISKKNPLSITAGVLAVRAQKKEPSDWPLVMSRNDFKIFHVWPALETIKEVYMAGEYLEKDEWLPTQDIILETVVSELVKTGDILEVGKFVVTDFNMFTQKLLGKLYQPSESGGWGNTSIKDNVVNHALTAEQIENIIQMKMQFGGDETLIPSLLEKIGVCKKWLLKDRDKNCLKGYWFPAIPLRPKDGKICLELPDAKRIVKRRFKLKEDFVFPPGFFADLFMSITGLNSDHHHARLWSDSLSFETLYFDSLSREDYKICLYICISETEESHYFDLTVCSNNPCDRVPDKCDEGAKLPRVWSWLMRAVSFIYTINEAYKSRIIVRQCCLHPTEADLVKDLRQAWKDRCSDNPLPRLYYYGSCGSNSATEIPTREEALVFAQWTGLGLAEVSRECHLAPILEGSVHKKIEDQLKPLHHKVKAVQQFLESGNNCESYADLMLKLAEVSESQHKMKGYLMRAVRENHSKIFQELRKISQSLNSLRIDQRVMGQSVASIYKQQKSIGGFVKATHRFHLDKFCGVQDMPLFPVISTPTNKRSNFTKTKQRLNYVCSICLEMAKCTGPEGDGYKIEMQKSWFTKALPYVRTVVIVLSIGLRVAGVPADFKGLFDDVFKSTNAIVREATRGFGEYSESAQRIAEANQDEAEPSFEVDSTLTSDVNQEKIDGVNQNVFSPFHSTPRACEEKGASIDEGTNVASDNLASMRNAVLEANKDNVVASNSGEILDARFPIVLPRRSTSEIAMLRKLIGHLDDCGSGPPQYTGLERVTCEWEGSTTWCCHSCKGKFEEEGQSCEKLIYEENVKRNNKIDTSRVTF